MVGVAVRDGRHAPTSYVDSGGCIRALGSGATLTLDGAVVSGCEAIGYDNGVRAPVRSGPLPPTLRLLRAAA